MDQFVTDIQVFVADLPPVVSVLAVALLGVVPFVESYLGTAIGSVAGVPLLLAYGAAVVGNAGAVLIASLAGGAVANRRHDKPAASDSRRARVVARTDRYGVPLASLLAPTVLAISLTTFIMVSVGYARTRVVIWQIIAAIVWGGLVAGSLAGVGFLTGWGPLAG
ncbi:hypothetical protein [Pseudactinotalea sp. Z1732]|uniref:hypothetical protein n=1 Tax=Micrococcales TaxID=85006 RepID=UPI003C7D8C2A